uniref:Ovule protein n=1 Tax=Meloidogyne incognita TaxID=6306 RepID=A0A914KRD3_MELIC
MNKNRQNSKNHHIPNYHISIRGGSEFRFPTSDFRKKILISDFRVPTPLTVPTHLWYLCKILKDFIKIVITLRVQPLI